MLDETIRSFFGSDAMSLCACFMCPVTRPTRSSLVAAIDNQPHLFN